MRSASVADRRPPTQLRPNLVETGNTLSEISSFVGRESELARLRELQVETRLLTIVGPGGVGKTRLALRLQSNLSDSYIDGTWLVDLTTVTDPLLVPQAVGDVFGVRHQTEESWLAVLSHVLRPRHLLLILDNCEHVVAACADLVNALLHACPWLHVLATSTQPLRAEGEVTWRLSPLVPAGADFQ